MKNCSHCQTQNVDTATFCKKCGNEIKDIRHTTVDAKIADVRVDTRPFHMRYPEDNLIPYSEHPANFVFNKLTISRENIYLITKTSSCG